MTYNITSTLRTRWVLQQIYHLVFPKSSQSEFHSCVRAKREQNNNNNIQSNDDCLTFPGIPIGVVPRLVIRNNSELACEMINTT